MTTEEFIAWFEGFTRRIKGRPSAKDWSEITAAIARIDGVSPLRAWFEGLLVKVKSGPTESEWNEIKRRVANATSKPTASKPGLNDSFKAFTKKAPPPDAKPASTPSYPGSTKPYGKR